VSTDETEKFYLTEIKKSGLNVQFIIEKDKSLYDAMNQAIVYALGQYSLFLNAGDILYSNNTISQVLKIVKEHPLYDFVYGDNYDHIENGKLILKKARSFEYLKHSLPTSYQAIFYRTALFEKYKYPVIYKICGDYALTAQIYFDGNKKNLKLNFPISIFRLGGLYQINRYL